MNKIPPQLKAVDPHLEVIGCDEDASSNERSSIAAGSELVADGVRTSSWRGQAFTLQNEKYAGHADKTGVLYSLLTPNLDLFGCICFERPVTTAF
jgi:hypothetical protein